MDSASSGDIFIPTDSSSRPSSDSPRKRKRSITPPRQTTTAKKSRHDYIRGYHEILNDTIKSLHQGIDYDDKYEPSQIGPVIWSDKEKVAFFAALERKGRDDIRSIAAAIGTKSEIEVEAYIRLIQQDTRERQRKPYGYRDVERVETSAATEISLECQQALEDAGDGLAARQWTWEESVERKKYGDFWRVDESTDLRAALNEPHNEDIEHFPADTKLDDVRRVAEMFDIELMMSMSQSIFMNSRNLEYQFRTYAAEGGIPSIQMTALLDLYNLVLLLVRRLVSTSCFMALSRLKAGRERTSAPKGTLKQHVKMCDVEAALDTLRVEARTKNDRDFAGAVRRCNVAVHNTKRNRTQKLGEEVSFDEVDEILNRRSQRSQSRGNSSRRRPQIIGDQKVALDVETGNEADTSTDQDESDAESIISDDSTSPAPISISYRELNEEEYQKKETEHLESIDQANSRDDENELWRILEGPDSQNPNPAKVEILPRPPHRSDRADIDWRINVDWKSSWERFEAPVLQTSFEDNKRIMIQRQANRLKRNDVHLQRQARDDNYDDTSTSVDSPTGGRMRLLSLDDPEHEMFDYHSDGSPMEMGELDK